MYIFSKLITLTLGPDDYNKSPPPPRFTVEAGRVGARGGVELGHGLGQKLGRKS
jgi:hypothetical protein